MRYGIIDIGSNTIRTVVYEVEGTDFSQLISEKDFSETVSYTHLDVYKRQALRYGPG